MHRMNYRNVKINGNHVEGEEQLSSGSWIRFSGDERLMKIGLAYDSDDHGIGLELYSLQDGYGQKGFVPCQGYDWSGIRDSSEKAIAEMLAVAERWAKENQVKWPWRAESAAFSKPPELLNLLKEAHDKLECFDAAAHHSGTCLDQRIKTAIANFKA